MSVQILAWSVTAAQILLGLAACCAFVRLVSGPRAQDRILGFDTLYVTIMMIVLTLGIQTGNTTYYEAALIVALLGSATTVAFAKFLMRGEVIE